MVVFQPSSSLALVGAVSDSFRPGYPSIYLMGEPKALAISMTEYFFELHRA